MEVRRFPVRAADMRAHKGRVRPLLQEGGQAATHVQEPEEIPLRDLQAGRLHPGRECTDHKRTEAQAEVPQFTTGGREDKDRERHARRCRGLLDSNDRPQGRKSVRPQTHDGQDRGVRLRAEAFSDTGRRHQNRLPAHAASQH